VSVLLAVDGGQTALRMAVVEDGEPREVAHAGGFAHGHADDARAIAEAVAEARAALGVTGAVSRACLGLTGAPGSLQERRRLAALVAERLDGAEVALGADMVTAHAGALRGAAGVAIAAGTGAVALGVAEDGTAHRADGLGFLLGDDGSGFAIGQAGLRAALRAHEGRGPATALQEAAMAFYGPLQDLPSAIRTSPTPVATVAAFAREVADVARAGDPVAAALWSDAARSLARTVAAVVRRTFPSAAPASVPVSHSGRLFTARDLLLEPFVRDLAALCPEARHVEPAGDALAGAALLVADGLGRYAGLLHTTKAWPT
jgi:N-acetylglucosamine kinase-like BadF-type ATPase